MGLEMFPIAIKNLLLHNRQIVNAATADDLLTMPLIMFERAMLLIVHLRTSSIIAIDSHSHFKRLRGSLLCFIKEFRKSNRYQSQIEFEFENFLILSSSRIFGPFPGRDPLNNDRMQDFIRKPFSDFLITHSHRTSR